MKSPKIVKKSKIAYYVGCYASMIVPRFMSRLHRVRAIKHFNSSSPEEQEYINSRVDYYCKIQTEEMVQNPPVLVRELGEHTIYAPRKYSSPYFFDTVQYTRGFAPYLHWDYVMGDVVTVPNDPSIVKSRPLCDENHNSVLMKLNKVRHYIFVEDTIPFEQKSDRVVFRGHVKKKPRRIDFVARFYDHPMCDVGETYSNVEELPAQSKKSPMSIVDHLNYKFIMTLEGIDVASNLKWVMSSNSVAVMPRPTCETWFMEGTLVPNYHYIEIADDYSDLEERIQYYIDHPQEAKQIARNANAYVAQFRNEEREDIISILVMQRYFEVTGQISK